MSCVVVYFTSLFFLRHILIGRDLSGGACLPSSPFPRKGKMSSASAFRAFPYYEGEKPYYAWNWNTNLGKIIQNVQLSIGK